MAQAPAPYAGRPQEVQEPDSLLPHAWVLGRGTCLKSVCEGPKGCGFAPLLLGGDVSRQFWPLDPNTFTRWTQAVVPAPGAHAHPRPSGGLTPAMESTPTPGPAEDSPLRWRSGQPMEHLTWTIQGGRQCPCGLWCQHLWGPRWPQGSSVSPGSRQHVQQAVSDPGVPSHCRLGTFSSDAEESTDLTFLSF